MKPLFVALLAGFLVLNSYPVALQPVSADAADLTALEGQWPGTWRSSRGNTGMISVVIRLVDPITKEFTAKFSESGLLVTQWEAKGKLNEKGEIAFEGAERVDTLRLDDEGKVLKGTYQWKTKSSHGTTEFRKK